MTKPVNKCWTLTYVSFAHKHQVLMFNLVTDALDHIRLMDISRFHLESSPRPKRRKKEVVH